MTRKKINVLVLGSTGMLGSVVLDTLKNSNEYFNIFYTSRQPKGYDKNFFYFSISNNIKTIRDDLEFFLRSKKIDFVINCIGITKPYIDENSLHSMQNALIVNSIFPIVLMEVIENVNKHSDTKINLLQIATDCVISGVVNGEVDYKTRTESTLLHDASDVYGRTKSFGETVHRNNCYLLRTSIIGPQIIKHPPHLYEWALQQIDEPFVTGFTNHTWNGITTNLFGRVCKFIMLNFEQFKQMMDDYKDRKFSNWNVLHLHFWSGCTKYFMLKRIYHYVNEYTGRNVPDVKLSETKDPNFKVLRTEKPEIVEFIKTGVNCSEIENFTFFELMIREMVEYHINRGDFLKW